MKTLALLALGAAAIAIAAPANAATITYTFSGNFTGQLNGADFSVPAVFTAVGDTATLSQSGLTKYVNLSSVSALSGGVTYTLSTTTQFYLNGGNYAGLFFGSNGTGGGAFSGTGAGLAGYDAVSSLTTTPLTATFTGPVYFVTDKGPVTLSSFDNATFSASLAAVPEPAAWGLMIVGFGAIGGALRRRQRTNVSVRYA